MNNELLDFLVTHPEYREKYNRFVLRIEREHAPLSFLAQYTQYGHQVEAIFKRFIEWNRTNVWEQIQTHTNDTEKLILITMFSNIAANSMTWNANGSITTILFYLTMKKKLERKDAMNLL